MKKLKTIKFLQKGSSLSNVEMGHILGGDYLASNINNGTSCTCKGSTDGWVWCNNNSNNANDCKCNGNGDNTNKDTSCSCGYA